MVSSKESFKLKKFSYFPLALVLYRHCLNGKAYTCKGLEGLLEWAKSIIGGQKIVDTLSHQAYNPRNWYEASFCWRMAASATLCHPDRGIIQKVECKMKVQAPLWVIGECANYPHGPAYGPDNQAIDQFTVSTLLQWPRIFTDLQHMKRSHFVHFEIITPTAMEVLYK